MIEPRNEFSGKVDGFETLEDNILLGDMASTVELPRGRRARHAAQ